jgi:hypothetical protein
LFSNFLILEQGKKARMNSNYIKTVTIFLLISGIILSGCINPLREVPVVKANVILVENNSQGTVDAESYTFTQGNVSYFNRPKKTQADSFPAIAGRIMIAKGNKSVIGPWEMLNYSGNGNYSFIMGFRENEYPVAGDTIHVSIMVVDKDGSRIGYIVDNIKWK